MKKRLENSTNRHAEIYQLLPWYVNGSMAMQQRSEVRNHIEDCLTCRVELEQLHQLSDIIIQSNQEEIASAAAFSKLKSNIMSDTSHKQAVNQWIARRLHRIEHSFLKPGLKPNLLTILAMLLFAILIQRSDTNNQIEQNKYYHTLSAQQSISTSNTDIRVVFSTDTDDAKIQQLLESIDAYIVSGPSLKGAYRIRIDQTSQYQEQKLQQLRNNVHVIFAEPAIALLKIPEALPQGFQNKHP